MENSQSEPTKKKCCCCSTGEGGEDRRCFCCRAMAVLCWLGLFVPSAFAGLWSLVSPLFGRKPGVMEVRVATLDALPEDGTPQKFPIIADRRDAWTQYPAEPIGAVYLRRVKDTVEAFQVVCPHAGCFIAYSVEKKQFYCPCHTASFKIDGSRIVEPRCDSPRDMDRLDVKIVNKTDVMVVFKKFQTGITEKKES